jgi:chemotaxis protein CheD
MTKTLSQQAALFLKPGEIVISSSPLRVTTLLGSCVAITLYSPRLRLGAICHALLPTCRREEPCCSGDSGKYVECALKVMLEEVRQRGVLDSELECKLFGGSDMFNTVEGRRLSVGRQNLEMALSVLEQAKLRIMTRDLGGARGRKIIFHTDSGDVYLKRLRKSEV